MKQAQYAPLSVADLGISLFAINRGYFDDVEVDRLLAFESSLHQFVKTKNPALVEQIMTKLELDAEGEKQLVAAVDEFKKSWA